MTRKMGPLASDHPLIKDNEKCPACKKAFAPGDYVTLIALGPGDNEEEQQKAREGRPYTAVAACVHWLCAGQ